MVVMHPWRLIRINKIQQHQGRILNALSGFTRDPVKTGRRDFEDMQDGVAEEVGIDY